MLCSWKLNIDDSHFAIRCDICHSRVLSQFFKKLGISSSWGGAFMIGERFPGQRTTFPSWTGNAE